MVVKNQDLINVLRGAIGREYEKIERAKQEIIKLKLDLLDLGVEFPTDD
jgi:hypothetical protein